MGNKSAKKTTGMIDQERNRQLGEDTSFKSMYGPERQAERAHATGLRDEITGGYRKLLTDSTSGTGLFGGGGGGGGYTAKTYTPEKAAFERAGLSGYSREAAGGYRDFANTGGLSENDRANMRSRATSVIPGIYDSLRNRMSQRLNAAGSNVGSIYSAASDRMARQSAQESGRVAREAEVDIADQVRQGRQFGLSGLHGVGQEETGLNQFNAGGFNDMSRFNTSAENDARMYNTSQANSAAASNAAAGRGADDDRRRAYMAGLGGMQDMYGSSPAELSRYDEMLMNNRGLVGGNVAGTLGLRQRQTGPEVSGWDRAMQGIGAATGIAGAMYSPGGFGGALKPPGTNVGFPGR